MAIFLANENLELAWVKSIFLPCLLCVSVPKWKSRREGFAVQALEMGNPKTNITAKPLSFGLGFASPFDGEVSAFLGRAFLTQHVWQARAAKNYWDEWIPWVPEQKMSSDGSWHLLYYSLSDSASFSCCTQPRDFNLRWLIQEITFSLPPHPTIPLFQSGDALSAQLFSIPAQGNTGSLELISLPVPAGGLPRAAARSWGLPCRHARGTTVIWQRLVQNQADFPVWCCQNQHHPTPAHSAELSPRFFSCTWLCSGGISLPP